MTNLKASISIFGATLALALFAATGCKKSEPVAETEVSKAAQPPAASAAPPVADAAQAAATQARTAIAGAASQAQALIDQAKSLVDAKQYTDASAILQQLAGLNLTADQQKLLDALRSQIQQAAAREATAAGSRAAGDLLRGKK